MRGLYISIDRDSDWSRESDAHSTTLHIGRVVVCFSKVDLPDLFRSLVTEEVELECEEKLQECDKRAIDLMNQVQVLESVERKLRDELFTLTTAYGHTEDIVSEHTEAMDVLDPYNTGGEPKDLVTLVKLATEFADTANKENSRVGKLLVAAQSDLVLAQGERDSFSDDLDSEETAHEETKANFASARDKAVELCQLLGKPV